MRRVITAVGFTQGAVQAVGGQERQAVDLDIVAHRGNVHLRRQQLRSFRRIDAIIAAVARWRRCDTHMHFLGAGLAQHLHDLQRGGAPHDRIIDEDDTLAGDHRAVGIVLELDTKVADLVAGLNEGAADIMRTDDAEFERQPGFLGKTDRRRCAAVGHRHHHIGIDRAFAGQFGADLFADLIDARAIDDRIGAAEIDMLEDARTRALRLEWPQGPQAARADDDQFTGLDGAQEGGADNIERDGFGGKNIGIAKAAQHQRSHAKRVAAGQHAFGRQADQAIGAFDTLQGIDEAIEQSAITRGGDKVDDHLGIAG